MVLLVLKCGFTMIFKQTHLIVADNSGVRKLLCVHILNSDVASIGDTVVGVVKKIIPISLLKKKDIVRAVIIRTQSSLQRSNGLTITFHDNAAIIINKNGLPSASRIFGPIGVEVRNKGFLKIISLATEIL